jgi:hypothetical protein
MPTDNQFQGAASQSAMFLISVSMLCPGKHPAWLFLAYRTPANHGKEDALYKPVNKETLERCAGRGSLSTGPEDRAGFPTSFPYPALTHDYKMLKMAIESGFKKSDRKDWGRDGKKGKQKNNSSVTIMCIPSFIDTIMCISERFQLKGTPASKAGFHGHILQ